MSTLVYALLTLIAAGPADPPKPAAAPATDKGPRISVEPATFDFGRVLQQRTLQKEFKVRNFGGADLLIEGVSTTCGCTTTDSAGQPILNKVLKPGGSMPMTVKLETRTAEGKLSRSVLIRSNDPAKPMLELKVEATVVPEGKDATPPTSH